tara:strand:+ start:55 stop:660 length:606 start_codon:yes stop_codon:yes gene_type:complete
MQIGQDPFIQITSQLKMLEGHSMLGESGSEFDVIFADLIDNLETLNNLFEQKSNANQAPDALNSDELHLLNNEISDKLVNDINKNEIFLDPNLETSHEVASHISQTNIIEPRTQGVAYSLRRGINVAESQYYETKITTPFDTAILNSTLSHKINGIQVIPGKVGYDEENAKIWQTQISTELKTYFENDRLYGPVLGLDLEL